MAKKRRGSAPRDRTRPFRMPKGPCDPEPPKPPPAPSPSKPFDKIWPDPLELLKLGKKR